MIAFIDDQKEVHGVESICKVLPIAPSTYHDHVAKRIDPARQSARVKRDTVLKPEISRVFKANYHVDFHAEVSRIFHREVSHLSVMFCGSFFGQGMISLFFFPAAAELALKRKLSFPVSRM